mmetsp:Transcript_2006/g.4056  ORF Transcript_2006/g.4056 Transcript_2006/m.4056 type:complete len:849 (-) Transcript_2006:92-2638(-)
MGTIPSKNVEDRTSQSAFENHSNPNNSQERLPSLTSRATSSPQEIKFNLSFVQLENMGTIPSKNVEDLTSQSTFENHSNPNNGSGSSNVRGFEHYGAASSHVKGNPRNSTSNSCYTGPTEAIHNGPRNTSTSKPEMDPSRFFYDNFPCVLPASQTPPCPQLERTVIFPGEYLPQSSTRSSLPTSSISSQRDLIANQQVFNLKEFTTNRQDTCNPRGQTTSLHTLDHAPRIKKRKISSLPTDLQSTTCSSAAHIPQEATHKSAAPKPVEATHDSMPSLSIDRPLAKKKAGRPLLKKKGDSCGKKLVNHEYRDFSNARCRDTYRKRLGRGHAIQFPERFHAMLEETSSDASLASIVSWKAHGRAFCVYDLENFVKFLIPVHFKQNKWSSFQRQLNIYGFKRLTQGRDSGCYYHESFLRGMPDLCSNLQRFNIKGNGTKATSNPNDEPDFYRMPIVDRGGIILSSASPGPISNAIPGPIPDSVPGPITDAVPGPMPDTVSDSNTVPGPISDHIPSPISSPIPADPGLEPVSSNTISRESCLIESICMIPNEAISKKLVSEQVVPNQVDADPKNLPVLESLKESPSEHSKLNSDFPNKINLLSSEDTESKKRHHSESTSRPSSKGMKFNSVSLKLYDKMSKLRPQQSTDSLLSLANIATDPLVEQHLMESMGHMFTNKQPDKVSTFLLSRNKSEQQIENSECAKSKKQEESFLKSYSLSLPTSLINTHTQGTPKNTQGMQKNQEELTGRRNLSFLSGDRIASSTTSSEARPRKIFSFPSVDTLLGYVAQDENVPRRQCSFPSGWEFKTNSVESLDISLSQGNLDLSAGFFKSSDDNMNEVFDLSHYVPKSKT